MSINSEKYLVQLIRKGDRSSFEVLFREYYETLCNYLFYFIKDKDINEQIVQDIFVNIWEKKKDFSPKGNLKSYLFRAVKNKAINYQKHELVKIKSYDEIKSIYFDSEKSVENKFDNKELRLMIEEGIKILPERCREIFILTKFQGFSYKETAEVLEISLKTVENQMGTALKKLREYLAKSYLFS